MFVCLCFGAQQNAPLNHLLSTFPLLLTCDLSAGEEKGGQAVNARGTGKRYLEFFLSFSQIPVRSLACDQQHSPRLVF